MTATFDHGYAVVIGVDANNIARLALPTVAQDVDAVHAVLVHPERCAYRSENVLLLKGERSTAANVLDALYWLRDKVQVDADATAVVYYSGHGMVDKATGQYYLIPYDIRAMSRIRADAIKAEVLTATIGEIAAKRLLVILDCCHAAGMQIKDVDADAGVMVEPRPFPVDLPATKAIPVYAGTPGDKDVGDLLEGEGRAILNSSTGEQSSYVRQDGKMSLFTYHLIEALTGHAPHPDDATVVYVTDVMSWVTHEVKKSAAREQVAQTPVMHTSGVFPVAQLLGGKGVAVSKGETAPDPLAELPATAVINQQGQTVQGTQVVAGRDASIGRIGDDISAGGDVVGGDKISVGDIRGSSGVAIGRGASSTVIQSERGGTDLAQAFARLQVLAGQAAPAMSGKVNALKELVESGNAANDTDVANLLQDIIDAVPDSVPAIVTLFNNPHVAATAGPNTRFVLGRLRQ